MECQGCGHNYPSTITRCTRCGRLTPKRTQSSRLIEFPRRPQTSESGPAAGQPAWKAEITERVRAAKARRNGLKPGDQDLEEIRIEAQADHNLGAPRREVEFSRPESPRVIESSRRRGVAARMAPDPKTPAAQNDQEAIPPAASRGNEQIIEAALLRARRASENASRAILLTDSRSQPRKAAPKSPLAVDKEATARAIEVAEEAKPGAEVVSSPVQPVSTQAAVAPARERETVSAQGQRPIEKAEARPAEPLPDISPDEFPAAAPIDEIEPRDYLTAEIKKVDREFGERFAHNESPELFAHVVLNVVDFLTIALSAAPFLALIVIYNGNLYERPTQIAAASVVSLIAIFYLALTQSLCGKTFGMMLTNTRLVDAGTFEAPSPQRALVRSAAYLIAVLPGLIGIIWLLFNRKRRGWHDLLSGTMIARDF